MVSSIDNLNTESPRVISKNRGKKPTKMENWKLKCFPYQVKYLNCFVHRFRKFIICIPKEKISRSFSLVYTVVIWRIIQYLVSWTFSHFIYLARGKMTNRKKCWMWQMLVFIQIIIRISDIQFFRLLDG